MYVVIDQKTYASLPAADASRLSSLAESLLAAAPPDHGPLIARALAQIGQHKVELDAVRRPPSKEAQRSAKRPADIAVDTSWIALRDRLTAYARLPHDRYPKAARAARLLERLLPDGTGFLNLPYDKQYNQGQLRLEAIDAQALEAELIELAGADFLTEVRATQAVYGEVLGISRKREPVDEETVLVAEPMRLLREAILYYTSKLIGGLDEHDPEAVATVREALRPIDDLRAQVAREAAAAKQQPAPVPEPTA